MDMQKAGTKLTGRMLQQTIFPHLEPDFSGGDWYQSPEIVESLLKCDVSVSTAVHHSQMEDCGVSRGRYPVS